VASSAIRNGGTLPELDGECLAAGGKWWPGATPQDAEALKLTQRLQMSSTLPFIGKNSRASTQ
jgi:hypothetical protein